jgi:hypothetical protein
MRISDERDRPFRDDDRRFPQRDRAFRDRDQGLCSEGVVAKGTRNA